MAISVNWATKVISIQQSDLTFLSAGRYELDVDALRLALRELEDTEEGSVFPPTHTHNTAITLSGVTYARSVEIINGYTVNFEDTGSPYMVVCTGANHNLGDVKTVDHVSLLIGNSAGLIQVDTGGGGGLTQQQVRDAMALALAPSETAEDGSIDKMLKDVHRIQGLEEGSTLEVTDTSRQVVIATVPVIEQTISDDGTTTTVERV